MKARTKLVLMFLVPFLISIIVYSVFLQMILESETRKWGDDEPPPFDLSDALEGYLVFLFLIFLSSYQGVFAFLMFLAIWMILFARFLSDYLKEKEKY